MRRSRLNFKLVIAPQSVYRRGDRPAQHEYADDEKTEHAEIAVQGNHNVPYTAPKIEFVGDQAQRLDAANQKRDRDRKRGDGHVVERFADRPGKRPLSASKTARLPKSFWDWDEMVEMNKTGYFPYTPSTNLLYGLSEAVDILNEEGLEAVFARHRRWAAGVRGAVDAWGLPIQCADAELHSPVLTGVLVPASIDADALRKTILSRFDLSLGAGLGKVKGRMFRIGHLGSSNDLTLLATLAGCEMGLSLAGVNLAGSGVGSAMEYFAAHPIASSKAA